MFMFALNITDKVFTFKTGTSWLQAQYNVFEGTVLSHTVEKVVTQELIWESLWKLFLNVGFEYFSNNTGDTHIKRK